MGRATGASPPRPRRAWPPRKTVRTVPAGLPARLAAAEDKARVAQLLGIGGLVVGLLGLGLGAFALLRRPAAGAAAPPGEPRKVEGD